MSFLKKQIITLDLPSILNPDSVNAFCEQWDQIDFNNTKAVVLQTRGSENACTGMDLKWVSEQSEDSIKPFVERFAKLLNDLMLCPIPLIAVVQGKTVGGGIGIVSACDVVIATEDSEFQLPECLLGFVPGVILPALLNRLTPNAIKSLSFTAQTYPVNQAKQIGLVDEITSINEMHNTIEQSIKKFAKCKSQSMLDLKTLLNLNTNSNKNYSDCFSAGVDVLCNRLKDPVVKRQIQNLAYAMN